MQRLYTSSISETNVLMNFHSILFAQLFTMRFVRSEVPVRGQDGNRGRCPGELVGDLERDSVVGGFGLGFVNPVLRDEEAGLNHVSGVFCVVNGSLEGGNRVVWLVFRHRGCGYIYRR